MRTVIADFYWTEVPQMRITIERLTEGFAEQLVHYRVVQHQGRTDDGIWFPYGEWGRSTEAGARKLANWAWARRVETIKAERVARLAARITTPEDLADAYLAIPVPAYGRTDGLPIACPGCGSSDRDNLPADCRNDWHIMGDDSAPVSPAPLGQGDVCQLDGEVYRIKVGQSSGRPYAERLVLPDTEGDKPWWQYAPGLMNQLTPEHRMDREAAQAFGRRTGTCCNCGKLLTHPISIERGMGPVCYGKWYDED